MDSVYHLDIQEAVSSDDEMILFTGINEEAVRRKGMDPIRTFGIFIKDSAKRTIGGLKAVAYYGCLYVDMLWLEQSLRHQGWGSRLMREVEKIGKEWGCRFATVSTMDWEALPFYQKLGYDIEFVRMGYEKDSKMFMLRKPI